MAIVQPIREDTFIVMMHGRPFSDHGLKCLFRHLEILSEETGKHVKLDVVKLCSQYSELHLEDMREFYGDLDGYPIHDDMEAVAEWIAEHTSVVYHSETHIMMENF